MGGNVAKGRNWRLYYYLGLIPCFAFGWWLAEVLTNGR
jgi:hypothetical protein